MAGNATASCEGLNKKLRDLKVGDHLCCIYQTDEEHRALITPFMADGLRAGQKTVYIADVRTAEDVLGHLRRDGVNVNRYLKTGQLKVVSSSEAYMPEAEFDPDRMISFIEAETHRALAEGHAGLRVTGEMTWALRGLPGSDRLIEYEAKLNEFLPNSKCLGLCQYDRRRFSSEVLLGALATHPIAVVGTKFYDNFYYVDPEDLLGPDPDTAELQSRLKILDLSSRAAEALRESEERFRSIYMQSPAGIELYDAGGRLVDANRACLNIFGVQSIGEVLGFDLFEDPNLPAEARQRLKEGKSIAYETSFDFELVKQKALYKTSKSGRCFVDVLITPLRGPNESPGGFLVHVRDITERKHREDSQVLIRKMLNELNRPRKLPGILRKVAEMVREALGIEAVGVRLRVGNDFPYFLADGFPEDFVQAENSLCARAPDGSIITDENGKPFLECMCGNVLSGRTVPSKSFFTPGGSFWTNSTTDLLADTSEEDRLGRTRKRYNTAGYESVALIPIRADDEIIGLLQLNGRSRNCFTGDMIRLMENAASSIGMAIRRREADEALVQSEQRFRSLVETTSDWIWEVDRTGAYTYASPRVKSLLGYDPGDLIGKTPFDLMPPAEAERVGALFQEIVKARKPFAQLENVNLHKNGRRVVLETSGVPIFDAKGRLRGYRGVDRDITDRKRAEEEIRQKTLLTQTLLDSLPCVAMLIRPRNRKIVAANAAAAKAGAVPGESCFRLWGGRKSPCPWCLAPEVWASGKPKASEIEAMGAVWDAHWLPVAEDLYLHYAFDITDRKKADEKIRDLAKFPSENPNPVLRVSRTGAILYSNEAGEPLLEFWRAQRQRKLPSSWHNTVVDALNSGQAQSRELEFGAQVFSLSFSPVREADYVNAYGLDITDRKRAEQAIKKLNETLEVKVEERTSLVKLLQDVAVIANEAGLVEEAIRATLRRMCEHMGWPIGHALATENGDSGDFADTGVWYASSTQRFARCMRAIANLESRGDTDCASLAISTARSQWVADTSKHQQTGRCNGLARLGLRAACALPVMVGDSVVAVLEFFNDKVVGPDEHLLGAMAHIGTQLGQVFERRQLQQQLIDAVWQEQRRFGQELHDGLCQQVAGIGMLAGMLLKRLGDRSAPEAKPAADLLEAVETAKEQASAMARALHPVHVDAEALPYALEELAANTQALYSIRCRFRCPKPVSGEDNNCANHLFRIAQEAVHNAAKHSGGKNINIVLRESKRHLTLEIRDDGVGIKTRGSGKASGVGLRIMNYRAQAIGATIEIKPGEKSGTMVRCRLERNKQQDPRLREGRRA